MALSVHILWQRRKKLTGKTNNSGSKLHGADLIACLDSLIPMQLALENTNLYLEALKKVVYVYVCELGSKSFYFHIPS